MSDAKKNQTETEGATIVEWNDAIATGIELIDNQHKQLVVLTNQLFQACTRGGDTRETVFKDVMSRMVEYVRVHFTTEQELLHRVKYPQYAEHKAEHDSMVIRILSSSKEYNEGNKRAASEFVKSLKEWIFGHIGHSDKMFAIYIADQKKKGLLNSKEING